MAGEPLTRADVSWHGVAGDRRWAFVRPDVKRSGFPWMTIRQDATMGRFAPRFLDLARPDSSATMVRTPDGEEFDVTDDALAALLGRGVRVIKMDVGIFDSMPLSLISTGTLSQLSQSVGRTLQPERFRPNLVVEPSAADPFAEDDWCGRTLRIGSLRMRVDQRDPRCVIVSIDPLSGRHDAEVLRHIARRRDGCAGVYGTTVAPGAITIGDAVVLEPPAAPNDGPG